MNQDCDTCRKWTWCESPCSGICYEPSVRKIAIRAFRAWLIEAILKAFKKEK